MKFRIRKPFGLLWLVFIFVLALGLSACGGDDGGEAADLGGSGGTSGGSTDGSSGGNAETSGEGSAAGSSGDSSGSGSGAVPDACSLLDTADVDAILGGSSSPSSTVSEDGQFSLCTWLDVNGGASLLINIWASGDAGEGWADQFITTQATAAQATEEVSGLGLKALIHEDNGDYSLYWNKENAYVVNLTVVGNTTATRDSVISLGKKIDGGF